MIPYTIKAPDGHHYFPQRCLRCPPNLWIMPRNRWGTVIARDRYFCVIEDRHWKYRWYAVQIGMGVYQCMGPYDWDDWWHRPHK